MSSSKPAPATRRRTGSTSLAVLVVLSVFAGVLGCGALTGSSLSAAGRLQGHRLAALGVADGEVPDGVTAFDGEYPGVANLDPQLLDALRRASTGARGDRVGLQVNSGWRSPAYQKQLVDEAVSEYGSRAEAARWVATPATSPHVSGDAVDIGGTGATGWLAAHGAEYGLCQIYLNEPWHFELRPDAVDDGCPARYADPTHDPRMQP
jgi:D-alanyl-D-alanine carboxypeptidase